VSGLSFELSYCSVVTAEFLLKEKGVWEEHDAGNRNNYRYTSLPSFTFRKLEHKNRDS
jgi:hypothetical protein